MSFYFFFKISIFEKLVFSPPLIELNRHRSELLDSSVSLTLSKIYYFIPYFTFIMSASVPLHLPTKSGIRAGGGSNPVTVVRVLYVHSMIDEKSSSTMLEEVTHKIVQSPLLVFTCITTSLWQLNVFTQYMIIRKELNRK